MNIHISDRIKNIAHHIPKGSTFADIGSDHALLPCFICYHDKTAKAIAGEVQQGPYKRAVENVKKFELIDQIDVRLGNGLEVVDDDIEIVVIAGMGGKLISRILQQDKDKLTKVNQLILQPNNHAHIVRETLIHLNFQLCSEMIMEENKQIYEILIAKKNHPNPYGGHIEKQLIFGPYLLKRKNQIFIEYWHSEYKNVKNIIRSVRQSKSNQENNLNELKKKLSLIEEVLNE